jgi:hypothetical protein
MAAKQITHKDRLDQDLAVGDCVAYPSSNSLVIGVITKFNPKMIKVCPFNLTKNDDDTTIREG